MCQEPDFDFPDSFIQAMRKFEARGDDSALAVTLEPAERQLMQKIAEQTGFSASAVASALLDEGLSAFRSRGIIF